MNVGGVLSCQCLWLRWHSDVDGWVGCLGCVLLGMVHMHKGTLSIAHHSLFQTTL